MNDLNKIINKEQIKVILKKFKGEKQLLELKFYLLTFNQELKEVGIEPTEVAWQIYKTNI